MPDDRYAPLFQFGPDATPYRRLDGCGVGIDTFRGRDVLVVDPDGLSRLAEAAFTDTAYFLRPEKLEQMAAVLEAPDASENERFVIASLLKNAIVAAEGVLPLCQDTGTATVFAAKGECVFTDGDDAAALTRGIRRAYADNPLRYSQIVPLSMFEERNSGDNLPAQIDLSSVPGDEYRFLFVAKGGGSSNKTVLHQGTKALLDKTALTACLQAHIERIGVAACPPYRLAVAIGGLSPEANLKTVKLACAGYLDTLPRSGSGQGRAFRDPALEETILAMTRSLPFGAQFGGRYFALDVRAIRLPRHAGSCPVGIGVSCSADRNARGKITREGVFLETLDRDPARFLPLLQRAATPPATNIDLGQGIDTIRARLAACPPGSLVKLNGPMTVARDAAHARIARRLASDGSLPAYLREFPVYYAGPAKTPPGMATGSFGPTTAERMDGYVDRFMAAGGSLVMVGKGLRSDAVRAACRRHGGYYLGAVGGAAALVAEKHIVASETIAHADLGMEAVRRIEVRDFPAFVLYGSKA